MLVVAEQVDAGGVGQPLSEVTLAARGRSDLAAEGLQLLEGVDPEAAESLHQAVEHVDGRPGVGQRPVVGSRAGVEDARQRGQLAVGGVVAGDDAAGQLGRVDDLEARPRPLLLLGEVAQETDVERGVVGHQHAALGELEERRQHGLDRGRVGDHGVGDAGQDRDEGRDLGARVDQGLELTEHLAAPDLHGADLGDHRTGGGRAARGLEVDHAERDVAQRPPQLVERALGLPSGRGPCGGPWGGRCGRAHAEDARSRHRQGPVGHALRWPA